MNQNAEQKQYKASIDRLYGIFKNISGTVNEVSAWRCPYKNAANLCTASFGCRNQDRDVPIGQPYICSGSDNLDYRSAWQI